MASISTDKSGNRRVLYFDENRKRRVLYVGKISQREAEGVQRRVESMLNAKILGNAIDRDDARWLSESPAIREKLERLNLISSGKIVVNCKNMTMEEFLDDYIERHGKSRKPATVAVWKQVVANLKEFMPAGIKINQITAATRKSFTKSSKLVGWPRRRSISGSSSRASSCTTRSIGRSSTRTRSARSRRKRAR